MRLFRHPRWQHLDYRVKVATTQENKPPTQGTRQWTFTTPRWRCGSILLPSLNAGVPEPTGGSFIGASDNQWMNHVGCRQKISVASKELTHWGLVMPDSIINVMAPSHYVDCKMAAILFGPQCVNSLAPRKFEWKFRYVIWRIISVIDGWSISCELALRWMSLDLTNDKSTLMINQHWFR